MSSSGESAEISYCASVLAKAFKGGGTPFSDVHDALGKFLSQTQLSKVEDLARKYADLPLHVLDRKIKWLESLGQKPAALDNCLSEVAASKLSGSIFFNGQSKERIASSKTSDANNSDIYATSKTDASAKLFPGKLVLKVVKSPSADGDYISETPVIAYTDVSKVFESLDNDGHRIFSEKVKPEKNEMLIEMVELNSGNKKEKIDKTLDHIMKTTGDLNAAEKVAKKKKNRKKKKKTKIAVIETSVEFEQNANEENAAVEDDMNATSSKSSRSARRRKLCKSRKKLENQTNFDENINEGDDKKINDANITDLNGEKQSVKVKDKSKKRSKNEKKQKTSASANVNHNDEQNRLCPESQIEKSKSERKGEEHWKLQLENIVNSSRKKEFQKRTSASCFEFDSDKTFKAPWQVDLSRKSNSGIVHSGKFSKTPMSCLSRTTTFMLDSAGGSIASSSEDNSSTSSNGVMEQSTMSHTLNVFSPTEGSNQICDCEEKEEETCHIYRNNTIMHFGTRWASDLSQFSSTGQENFVDLQQTDVENLLHNDLGLDFFNNHLDDLTVRNTEVISPGAIDVQDRNFESEPNSQSGLTLERLSEATDVNGETESPPLPIQNQEGRFLKDSSTFDYDGAVQFLWKEWNRVSDKAIYKK